MYTFEKTVVLYNICSKCGRKREKTIKEEVLTKISKVLDLVNNIEKCQKDKNSLRRKNQKNICKIIVSIYLF